MRRATTGSGGRAGFTLVEVLASMTILIIIVGMVISMTNQTSKAWTYSSEKIGSFQSARFAFETITRAVSNATLNTYYDYYDATRQRRTQSNVATFAPNIFGRCSELEFVCGKNLIANQVTHAVFFQTPLSYTQNQVAYGQMQSLLNVVGFYIKFADDSATRPAFLSPSTPKRSRYRLMELVQPTEQFSVYNYQATNQPPNHDWFTAPAALTAGAPTRLLAENIIACVIWPKLARETPTTPDPDGPPLAPNFEYDSNIANATPPLVWTAGQPQPPTMNQLPPVVRIMLVAVDERSMARLQGTSTAPPDLGIDLGSIFQTASQLYSETGQDDLTLLGNALTAKKLNYRIFQTDVAIHGAKWSP